MTTIPDPSLPPGDAGQRRLRPAAPGCCEAPDYVEVASAPRVGPFPELKTYRCRRCGHVETVESAS